MGKPRKTVQKLFLQAVHTCTPQKNIFFVAQKCPGLAPLSPGSLPYVLYVLYGSYTEHPLSPGSLLYVLYVLYLTRQPTEHPLSPGSLLYVLYVLYTYARKSVLYVLYRAI